VIVVTVVAAAAALVTLGACGSETAEPAPEVDSIDDVADDGLLGVDEFADYIESDESILVINVHVPYDGHLGGTDAFVPFDSIVGAAELPADTSAPIALYCRSGAMSATATAALYDAGYTNVVDLDGGMNAWTGSGRALIDDPTAVG